MKKLNYKNLITLLLVFMLSFITISPINVVFGLESYEDNLIEELENVDLSVYENADKTDVIFLAEKDFSKSEFSITVYVYNASKLELETFTGSNAINLACKFDDNNNNNAIEYKNFKLRYISKTEDNSIYKFSVVDSSKILELCYKNQNKKFDKRCYKIAGIQLHKKGERLADDYNVGLEYVYSGNEKNSTHKLNVIETIELDVHDVWYRTKSSSNGKYHQNQVNSVYFAVPDRYLKGSSLTGIKAEWYEYKTQPIAVLEEENMYNTLINYLGRDIGLCDDNIKYKCADGDYRRLTLTYGEDIYSNDAGSDISYLWGYNVPDTKGSFFNPNPTEVLRHDTTLYYAFYTNGQPYKDYEVDSDILTNYIYNYNKTYIKGELPIKNGRISADLFQENVDDGRVKGYNEKIINVDDTFDLFDYNDTHSWWDSVADYGFFETLFGNVPGEESRSDLTPIYMVDLEKDFVNMSEVDNNLLIDERFVSEFYNFANKNKNDIESKTTFLFRFANTDYLSADINRHDGRLGYCGYIAEETVFLNFDIIQLEFTNGDKSIIYPVVSSPIDSIASLTPPVSFYYDYGWLIYAIIVIALCVLGIIFYNKSIKEI